MKNKIEDRIAKLELGKTDKYSIIGSVRKIEDSKVQARVYAIQADFKEACKQIDS